MELDDLKSLWERDRATLERTLRLNAELLRQGNARRAEGALRRLQRSLRIEIAVLALVQLGIGSFAVDYHAEGAYFACAVTMGLYMLALLLANGYQLAMLSRVDFDEPVVAVSRSLATLRLIRARTILAAVGAGVVVWLPATFVVLRALGIDALRSATPAYIVANLLFGVLALAAAVFAARRFDANQNAFADALAGREVTAALALLDSVRRFEAA